MNFNLYLSASGWNLPHSGIFEENGIVFLWHNDPFVHNNLGLHWDSLNHEKIHAISAYHSCVSKFKGRNQFSYFLFGEQSYAPQRYFSKMYLREIHLLGCSLDI